MKFIVLILCFALGHSVYSKTGVVFIPGLGGSHLKISSSDDRIYFSVTELWKNHTLAIDSNELNIKGSLPLEKDGIIHAADNIYGLGYYYNFSRSLKKQLDKLDVTDYSVKYFDYDWRLSIAHNAGELDKFINSFTGIDSWILIAHSMGGLVASYYLRYGASELDHAEENWKGLDKVKKVVFGGTPFRGSILTFQEMVRGRKPFGTTNKSLFSATASSSFPSYYMIFPFNSNEGIINEFGKDVSHKVFHEDYFKQEKWGLMDLDHRKRSITSSRKGYIKKSISDGKTFSRLMVQRLKKRPENRIQILNIISDEYDTLVKVAYKRSNLDWYKSIFATSRHLKKANITEVGYEDLYKEGDGTVSTYSSAIPKWMSKIASNIKKIKVDSSHGYLYSNKTTIKEVISFVKGSADR